MTQRFLTENIDTVENVYNCYILRYFTCHFIQLCHSIRQFFVLIQLINNSCLTKVVFSFSFWFEYGILYSFLYSFNVYTGFLVSLRFVFYWNFYMNLTHTNYSPELQNHLSRHVKLYNFYENKTVELKLASFTFIFKTFLISSLRVYTFTK